MHQGDLFPEGAELWGLALVDLERLDLVRARTHLARAEALPRGRREADEIGGAVDWLEGCGLGPAAELDRAVEAFRETPEAVRVGLIGAGAARRADESIARFLLSR